LGPIDGLEPIKRVPPATANNRASTTAPEPAVDLVAALLRVMESGANLIIGIAPSDSLTTAINRQTQLDRNTGVLVIDQTSAGSTGADARSMVAAS
jgi:hypothetical protein